jgi:hypothetical protein
MDEEREKREWAEGGTCDGGEIDLGEEERKVGKCAEEEWEWAKCGRGVGSAGPEVK